MKKYSILTVLLLLITHFAYSHPWEPKHFVIIDIDGGLDDFRALNLMLASPDVRVLAITTSNGVLDAKTAYYKLKAFLKDNYHDGILTGAHLKENRHKSDCKAAKLFKWGTNEEAINKIPGQREIILKVIKNTHEKITFVNLGSLSSFNSAYKSIESLASNIKAVFWACNYKSLHQSFNYLADTAAWHSILKENIQLNLINGTIKNFDYENFKLGEQVEKNPYADNFVRSLTEVNSPFALQCYDETLPIFLHYPEFFKKDSINPKIICFEADPKNKYNKLLANILYGKTVNLNQVFSGFPMDTSFYADDVKAILPEALKKYGRDEWVATVMANEMHRHLGIYAVIGTKMGIRAREHFGAGIDETQLISWAGTTPPFSCLNDGLQISTGATLGHGLIKLKADSLKQPKTEFIYMNRKIAISLKEEYRKRIESEIKTLVLFYGLDNDIYWDLVRKYAIDFWRYWDRHEIFNLEIINE